MSYQTFKTKYPPGSVTDYDGVYGFQCVDLVKRYLNVEFGIKPGAWGDAIKYATNPNPALLEKFSKVSLPTKAGDIVVFRTAGRTDNSGSGHIGIADGVSGATVPTLEQNGSTGNGKGKGGDAIRVRNIDASRVAAVYRPKTSSGGRTVLHLNKGTDTTFYKIGGGTFTIHAKDDTYDYKVLEDLGNKVLVNSASGGGRGYIYLIYTATGKPIPGRSIR